MRHTVLDEGDRAPALGTDEAGDTYRHSRPYAARYPCA